MRQRVRKEHLRGQMQTNLKLKYILSILLIAIVPLRADVWGLEELMVEMGRIQQSRAKFTEKKHLTILKEPMVYEGTLSYQKNGSIKKTIVKPAREVFTIHKSQVSYENPKKGIQRSFDIGDHSSLLAFVASMRSTLEGDLKELRKYYTVSFEGIPGYWILHLVPREDTIGKKITRIKIQGSRTFVNKITIHEKSGDYSIMTVSGHQQEKN